MVFVKPRSERFHFSRRGCRLDDRDAHVVDVEPAVALNLGVAGHAELELVPVGVVHVAALSFDGEQIHAILAATTASINPS